MPELPNGSIKNESYFLWLDIISAGLDVRIGLHNGSAWTIVVNSANMPGWWVERKRATAGLLTKVRIYAPAIPHVEAEVDLLKTDGLPTEQIMAEAHDFHSRWPKMDEDERRKILELIVKSVVIGNGGITLNLCYLPSFEVMSNGQHML